MTPLTPTSTPHEDDHPDGSPPPGGTPPLGEGSPAWQPTSMPRVGPPPTGGPTIPRPSAGYLQRAARNEGGEDKRQGGLFISYRRGDAAGHAGRLYDDLKDAIGADRVFMDVAKIEPGADFAAAITEVLERCDTMLVVIGPNWLHMGAGGQRRLDDRADYVRSEVASAVRRGIRLIPVLVNGAAMPGEADLPDDLKPLARRQAFDLADPRWGRDVAELVATLRPRRRRRRSIVAAVLLVVAGAIGAGVFLVSGNPTDASGRAAVASQALLSDPLRAVNHWPQRNDETCKQQLTPTGYSLTNSGTGTNSSCFAIADFARDALNVSVAASVTFPVASQGASGVGALECRYNPSGGYRAGIDANGNVRIGKYSDTSGAWLARDTIPIESGAAQRLRFDCVNQPDGTALLTLFKDDRPVLTKRDPRPLPTGQVGMEAMSYKAPPITAEFTDFVALDLSRSAPPDQAGSPSSTGTAAGESRP